MMSTDAWVFSLTYGGAFSFEDVTVEASALEKFLVAVTWDPRQLAGAVERADVDVQRPHVITYHVAIHWKCHKNQSSRQRGRIHPETQSVNLLDANLERAHPTWSFPPFRKKSM